MRNIRIIHLISSLKRGGRERQLAMIVANTDNINYPTKVIYFNKQINSYIDEYEIEGVTIKLKHKKKIPRILELHQILKKEEPGVVFAWGNGEALSLWLLKPFHNYIFINGSVRHGIRSRKISHFFRSLILFLSKNIVANSHAGLKANNLRKGYVLYNGVEQKFLDYLQNRQLTRQLLTGISGEIPLLVSVANLVSYKDYATVFKALRSIMNDGYKFYYIILGDGPMRHITVKTIRAYHLNDHVKIMGNVENVPDYLKISDIFIHSSKGEGCSNAILEAMATGLPIIASNTGGTAEIVTEDNSLLFEYRNHEQLAEHLKYCLMNREKSELMGKKSREIVKNRYSKEAMMSNFYGIISMIWDS